MCVRAGELTEAKRGFDVTDETVTEVLEVGDLESTVFVSGDLHDLDLRGTEDTDSVGADSEGSDTFGRNEDVILGNKQTLDLRVRYQLDLRDIAVVA